MFANGLWHKICVKVLLKSGHSNLVHVPDQYKTLEMCEKTVETLFFAFECVRDRYVTRETLKNLLKRGLDLKNMFLISVRS